MNKWRQCANYWAFCFYARETIKRRVVRGEKKIGEQFEREKKARIRERESEGWPPFIRRRVPDAGQKGGDEV